MEENTKKPEYNWNLILSRSSPVAVAVGAIFYYSERKLFLWSSLAAGMVVAGLLIYAKDSKKQNVFTGCSIILLVAVAVYMLKKIGII